MYTYPDMYTYPLQTEIHERAHLAIAGQHHVDRTKAIGEMHRLAGHQLQQQAEALMQPGWHWLHAAA